MYTKIQTQSRVINIVIEVKCNRPLRIVELTIINNREHSFDYLYF